MDFVKSKRLEIEPLEDSDYPEADEVYRCSRRFLEDICGGPTQNSAEELVIKDADEARAHNAVFAVIRLTKNRKMIGVVCYEPSGYGGEPSCAWIGLLMVAEPFQRQGYGAEACRIIENEILSNPVVKTLKLGVLSNNPAALAFWSEMGYRETAQKNDDSGHKILVMEKKRQEPIKPDGRAL